MSAFSHTSLFLSLRQPLPGHLRTTKNDFSVGLAQQQYNHIMCSSHCSSACSASVNLINNISIIHKLFFIVCQCLLEGGARNREECKHNCPRTRYRAGRSNAENTQNLSLLQSEKWIFKKIVK